MVDLPAFTVIPQFFTEFLPCARSSSMQQEALFTPTVVICSSQNQRPLRWQPLRQILAQPPVHRQGRDWKRQALRCGENPAPTLILPAPSPVLCWRNPFSVTVKGKRWPGVTTPLAATAQSKGPLLLYRKLTAWWVWHPHHGVTPGSTMPSAPSPLPRIP